jgi:hypothetical protein
MVAAVKESPAGDQSGVRGFRIECRGPSHGGLSRLDEDCFPIAMLELIKVNDVVNKTATATLKRKAGVQRVFSEPASDSEGHEALRITIVLKRGSAGRISGEKALDALVGTERALREAGDDRFPILEYVTEEELESRCDTGC